MNDKSNNTAPNITRNLTEEKAPLNPLPVYPPADDIYNKNKEEENINPEDISKAKTPNSKEESSNEMDFDDDVSGEDLDIPGAELDDEDEAIGSEDEENNHYSMGGDNHNNLDEDKGE
jgi:hypothetical protein